MYTSEEEDIICFIERKDSFTEEEVVLYMGKIADCIKSGTPASYFSQALDKIIDNQMGERDRDLENSWQLAIKNNDSNT